MPTHNDCHHHGLCGSNKLLYKRCAFFYIIKGVMFVCLSVSMFRMAGQMAGPIETKLDTRTDVHPGSVSVKVNVKVIHVCVRE